MGQIFEEVAKIVGWTEREKRFLTKHFGEAKCLTYEEVGAEVGITRERARQIIRKALRKMYRDQYPEESYQGLLKRVELETKDGTLDWAKIRPGKKVPTFIAVYPARASKTGRPIGKATRVVFWIDENEDDDANRA